MYSADGAVLAYQNPSRIVYHEPDTAATIATIEYLGSTVLKEHADQFVPGNEQFSFAHDGRQWRGTVRDLRVTADVSAYLGLAVPEEELFAQANTVRQQSLWIALGILILTLPFIWLIAHRLVVPLRTLARESELIQSFNFGEPITMRSSVLEIDGLAGAMAVMKSTVHKFLTLIRSLAGEKDFETMLTRIADETLVISQTDRVAVYLLSDDGKSLQPFSWRTDTHEKTTVNLADDSVLPILRQVRSGATYKAIFSAGESGNHKLVELMMADLNANTIELVCMPLRDRKGEVSGVLLIVNQLDADTRRKTLDEDHVGFVRALSGFAAVSLENQRLLKGQKELLESFIKLIASAIDAKSPYTAGHCQRVPMLTKMLAEAACESDEPPFDDFNLDDAEWEAVHIASWLHDCGKVTTPEYVVDKATKLQTIYDRLHEIRMRFEVLKCQAETECWREAAKGGNEQALLERLRVEWQQLDDEFDFIATCNQGGEFMDPVHVGRVNEIARRKWRRTLNDRIGLSWEEVRRKVKMPEEPLPCDEPLLADREDHLVRRAGASLYAENNRWGFKLNVAEYEYNLGEVYNLSIGRGTLTAEERYKINDHIVQTIIMLEELPYPRHLRNVPSIAGGHHETMDGTGYPRRLKKDDMAPVARMMAVADIFEALTAADRPYKKAKTLSDSLQIMVRMCKGSHIDAELFRLFLKSGVYMKYAKTFLNPEQIDDVNVDRYLASA